MERALYLSNSPPDFNLKKSKHLINSLLEINDGNLEVQNTFAGVFSIFGFCGSFFFAGEELIDVLLRNVSGYN